MEDGRWSGLGRVGGEGEYRIACSESVETLRSETAMTSIKPQEVLRIVSLCVYCSEKKPRGVIDELLDQHCCCTRVGTVAIFERYPRARRLYVGSRVWDNTSRGK